MDKPFITKSIWIAAAINVSTGLEPEYEKDAKGVVLFRFDDNAYLRACLDRYNNADLPCDALSYSTTVRRYRGDIAVRKTT